MKKYVLLFVPGGLNDILATLDRILKYCKRNNRILLFDMKNTLYNINFANYFDIDDKYIIYDSYEIKNIIFFINNVTLYPTNLNANIKDISELFYNFYKGKKKTQHDEHNTNIFKYNKGKFSINGVTLNLPSKEIKNDIIIYATGGGGHIGFNIFKSIILKNNIKSHIKENMSLLPKNYLSIQVRNTDLKCNLELLYNQNKDIIHSYDYIYLSTDHKQSIDFLKSKNLNVFCFNTFPETGRKELHYSNIDPDIKIKDVFTDIFIVTNSKLLLSNSKGGFIYLLRKCNSKEKKQFVLSKLN